MLRNAGAGEIGALEMKAATPPVTSADVRAIARELPDAEPATMYGAPGFRLRGRFLACMAINKAAEPNTLAVAVGFEARDTLVASEPDTYYLKDHYVDYPVVLVRLSRIQRDALASLLREACHFVRAGAGSGRRRSPVSGVRPRTRARRR
jgi:hypothetical protein